MTFVNMERIEKRFNNQSVLRDVSLKMNRGEIVSIIGPSGSGKSTFLRCLGQLETIDGGSITVDGTVLASTENGVVKYASPQTQHELLLRMGMVFQSFNLFPHMTVLDNIMIAPRMVKGMKDTDIMPIAEPLWLMVLFKKKEHQNKFLVIRRTKERKRSWIICYRRFYEVTFICGNLSCHGFGNDFYYGGRFTEDA